MSNGAEKSGGTWQLRVDTGGTFTDCLARDPSGRESRVKVLSSSCLRGVVRAVECGQRLLIDCVWSGGAEFVTGFTFRVLGSDDQGVLVSSYDPAGPAIVLEAMPRGREITPGLAFELLSPEPAPLLAARLVTGTPLRESLPPMDMRLATTRGTNALLTLGGAPPLLVTNRGFADLPFIGTQARPKLFALHDERSPRLHEGVMEIDGRLDATGREIEALDLEALREEAVTWAAQGARCAAVALLHADRSPAHEEAVATVLHEAGFQHISCSSSLAPSIRILPRMQTAIINAYLSPLIEGYLATISGTLVGRLHVMTSAGGLENAASYHPKDSLLSGPAGGIAGAARAAEEAGLARILAFDMGGTSTDVARYDGDFEYVFQHQVGGALLVAPALAIESVAAGGGSICTYDGVRLRVGPESAAAHPGPACYGAGGPLSVTDLNLLLGRIDSARFEIPIDEDAARAALDAVREQLFASSGERLSREELLEGFLDLANAKMADAIRRISLRSGYDPQEYTLLAFGGAGPQHAFGVAEELDMSSVLIPPNPSLLSAEGLDDALVERFAEEQILAPLDEESEALSQRLASLESNALDRLAAEGVSGEEAVIRRRIASMRFQGQDATLEVNLGTLETLREDFLQRYVTVFGHVPDSRAVEIVSLRVVASSRRGTLGSEAPVTAGGAGAVRVHQVRQTRFSGEDRRTPVYLREELPLGARISGPCLVQERYSITVVESGWSLELLAGGGMLGHREERAASGPERDRGDAIRLELFSQRLARIAEEMGAALGRSAVSTNIKERLDFSCAVLDSRGELLVNAPHIPVHLGSLGLCVRALAETMEMQPGDTIVTNHPAYGGSHLPDVTLVSPAHDAEGHLIAYVASRAHHAEIGGSLPGSMPPHATCLADEGVVIEPMLLVRGGEGQWDAMRRVLESGPYPSRAVSDNLADLRAAAAANHRGVTALGALAGTLGDSKLAELMEALKDRAANKLHSALLGLGDRECTLREELDDGAALALQLVLRGGHLRIDFSASSGTHPGNLNATPAIVRSAVLYTLRLLLAEDLPLNEGLMRNVELVIPPGILSPTFPADPKQAPAVVGGNVELSQRLVNLLVRALGIAASSQGTMNNLLFGDDSRSYYETICGGCGGGPGFDGPSAVHSHMTNTRITDVEILEHRYPVRVHRFAVRRGSGGAGRHPGGDGVIREIEFLAPMSLSLLTQHRRTGPAGLAGGAPGQAGRQTLIRRDGTREQLGASDSRQVRAGDRLVIETPGGGGYGAPSNGNLF